MIQSSLFPQCSVLSILTFLEQIQNNPSGFRSFLPLTAATSATLREQYVLHTGMIDCSIVPVLDMTNDGNPPPLKDGYWETIDESEMSRSDPDITSPAMSPCARLRSGRWTRHKRSHWNLPRSACGKEWPCRVITPALLYRYGIHRVSPNGVSPPSFELRWFHSKSMDISSGHLSTL